MVDWKEFSEKEKYREGTPSQELYDEAVDKLIEEEVLSLNPKNNYFISTSGICLSPRTSRLWGQVLYFTKEKEAEEYAKINFSKAMYPVSVERNI